MARARNIKPAIMANEDLAELAPAERLLFIYLWMLADREGRLEDRPKRIKAEAFPYDDVDIDAMLDNLQGAGFLIRYTVESKRYIQILNFTKHQRPHSNETASNLPPMEQGVRTEKKPEVEPVQSVSNHGEKDFQPREEALRSDLLIPDLLIPDTKTPPTPTGESPPVRDDLFDQFWALYPNKTCKAKARAKWVKLKVTPILFDQIMSGLRRQCASQAWLKDGGQFVPHPTTWLNGERWNDEVRSNVHHLPSSRHHGFDDRDYTAGLIQREDGTYGF
ncbi:MULTISPECIES: hypothetical protein [Pseudomonas]|uniref:hypothetical protein n=1 Tax=Pseudomonas TaxID=286 RepID=UPI0005B94C57|nr:hypothetical protein [Pseudomonas sp. PI1]KWR85492.1 phage replication protein [Pseudomonas sp. PI1]